MRFINKIISQPKSPVAKNSKINEVPDAKKSHRLFSLTFDWFLLEFIIVVEVTLISEAIF